jgi:hypothetical protein
VGRGRRGDDAVGQRHARLVLQGAQPPRERRRVHLGDALDGPVDVAVVPRRAVAAHAGDDRRAVRPNRERVGLDRVGDGPQRRAVAEDRGRVLEDHRARPAGVGLEERERRDRAEAVADEDVRPLGVQLAHRGGEDVARGLAGHRAAAVAGLVDGRHVPAAGGQRRAHPPPRVGDR